MVPGPWRRERQAQAEQLGGAWGVRTTDFATLSSIQM